MSNRPTRTSLAVVLATGALALSACAGGGASDASSAAPSTSAGAASSTAASAASSSAGQADAAAPSTVASSSPAAATPTAAPAAKEVMKDVRKNLADAKSVHMEAEFAPGTGDGVASMDLEGATDDSFLRATVVGEGASAETVRFIHVDGETYVSFEGGSDAESRTMSQLLRGRYVQDTEGAFPRDQVKLDELLSGIRRSFDEASDADVRAMKGEVVTVDGETMFRYSDRSAWTMTVDRQHRLRGFEDTASQGTAMSFDRWDEVEKPAAPAAEDVVTMQELQKEMASSVAPSSAKATD